MAEQASDTAQNQEQSSDSTWAEKRLEEAKGRLAKAKKAYDEARDFLKKNKDRMQKVVQEAVQKRKDAQKPYVTAIKALNEAREEQHQARNALRSSKKELERIQNSRSKLERKRDEARRKGVRHQRKIQKLDSLIQEDTKREEEKKKSIEAKEDSLTTATQGLSEAEKKLDEPEKKYTEANRVLREARDSLFKARHKVLKAATQVNRKAVVLPWWLTVIRTRSFVGKLLSFGLTMQGGGAYAYLTLLGATYEIAFYCSVHINILDYAAPTDFLLSGFKLLLASDSGMLSAFLQYIYLLILDPITSLLDSFFKILSAFLQYIYSLIPDPITPLLDSFFKILSAFLQYIYSPIPDPITPLLDSFDLNALPIIVSIALCILALGVLLLIVYGIIVLLAFLPIWGYARGIAYYSVHAEHTPIRPILFVLFLLIPATGTAIVGYEQSKHAPKDIVSVVTTQPLQGADTLVRVGSVSSYIFFRKLNTTGNDSVKNMDPSGTSNILVVPVSQIVCIGETDDGGQGCTSEETIKGNGKNTSPQNIVLSKEDNPWIDDLIQAMEENITENGVRHYISQQMDCDKDQRLEVSDFIRFEWGKAALDPTEEGKVVDFVDEWKERPEKWAVFGFASPDGERGVNEGLSKDRAKAVESELCAALDAVGPKRECEERDVTVKHFDEDHPINGIANSRSARIAVCTKREASQVE